MGLEPTTPTLATWRSTTELHPPGSTHIRGKGIPHSLPHYKAVDGQGKREKGERRWARPKPAVSVAVMYRGPSPARLEL
jgi:hypothetical protein